MPSSVVKSFAPKYAEQHEMDDADALAKLEELWDRAKTIAKKKFDEENDTFWSYVMGIWKRMVGYDKTEATASTPASMLKISIKL